jgi:hypothetical protein
MMGRGGNETHMNEEKLFALLGAIVETNQKIVAQSEAFLNFLALRDERIPERVSLEIVKLKNDILFQELELPATTDKSNLQEMHLKHLSEQGMDQEDWLRLQLENSVVTLRASLETAKQTLAYARETAARR